MDIGVNRVKPLEVVGNEARKAYFLEILLKMLISGAYIFTLVSIWLERPLLNTLFNLVFGVIFTVIFYTRKSHIELSIFLGGLFFQVFIFGHSYFVLPGKQLEMGFGILTAIMPIFVFGPRLWFFFIGNFLLYHIALFSAGYENIFYFQYGFYIVLFIMTRTILKENQQYEKALIIQRDKIKRDAETLKEADELKTRFFANISHELRTPLTLILSPMATILKSNELSNKHATYLQLMQQNGKKLLKRINELLELSRLGANKLDIKESPVNIYQLTKQIAATYEGAANLKSIELDYTNELDNELNLKLDIPKLEMIISNYLSNAIKFTPKNGTITIHVLKVDNQLQISVKDTGIGIPSSDLNQVFNRFYQVKRDSYHEGTGIGLALCKELAELHGGKVWVESKIGTGSTFFVQLPYKETFAKIATALTQTPILNEPKTVDFIEKDIVTSLSKPTILVVEDSKDLRQYIELLLSDNYNIITVENGKEALTFLNKPSANRPAAIISDIMMPVMDGMTLIKELKRIDDFRQIPVIMLTAQKNTDVKIEALRIGIDDYLTKPFQAEELLARVQNLIANMQQRIQIQPRNNATQSNTTITAFDLKWLKDIEEKILVNIGNTNFKLNDLAAEMNVSTRTMQMRIKAITGQTPKKYQRSIQLHHARKLLKSGEIKTISELSYQLGFEDQHYFSKLYKAEFGITPKEALQNIE